jgi:hypothetical protein
MRILAVFSFLGVFCCPLLHADVGLLLSESLNDRVSQWVSSGHSAIYLSRLCPETPVKLRLCASGESGSVISMYNKLDEDQNFEWNTVPLSLFLYGVEDESDRPLLAWPALFRLLQDQARETYLAGVCQTARCAANRQGNWRELFASTFIRDIYVFQVKTTLQQDLALMTHLNAKPNVNHYSGFTNNCADFAAAVLNFYFPGSARPDHMNDFGITSPKAISKSFTRYARRHPALELRIFRFAQVPGTYSQSHDARKGDEMFFTSKKVLLPMLLRPHVLALFIGGYSLTGRFNPEHELRRQPGDDNVFPAYQASVGHQASMEQQEMQPAHSQPVHLQPAAFQPIHFEPIPLADYVDLFIKPQDARPQDALLGTDAQWKSYRKALTELANEAVSKKLIGDRKALHKVVKELGKSGQTSLDSGGAPWLEASHNGSLRRVGVAASNVNAPESDPELAYLIMLSRMDAMLGRSSKDRELLPRFERDWQLMLESRQRLWPAATRTASGGPLTPGDLLTLAPR